MKPTGYARLLVLVVLCCGCQEDPVAEGPAGSTADATSSDAGITQVGDGKVTDSDTGEEDTGEEDTGEEDATTVDTGEEDATTGDTGEEDATTVDTGEEDATTVDTVTPPQDTCLEDGDDCQPNATCAKTGEVFECVCDPGYLAEGQTCDDLDECAQDNGGCGQSCVNEPGSFTCSCADGFSINADGLTCDDVDECATDNGGCPQMCINEVGSFTCCAPALVAPAIEGCDGVPLTAISSIDVQSEGITEVPGPSEGNTLRIEDDQSIDLKDEGCLQLGKDGEDFSLSMWLRAWGSSQLIGTKSQYDYDGQGFVLLSEPRGDGLMEVRAISANGVSGGRTELKSPPFEPGVWTHVVVSYVNAGDASTFTTHLNTASVSGWTNPDVYNEKLRIGDEGWGSIEPFEISDMRSYGRALTSAEVDALFFDVATEAGFSSTDLSEAIETLIDHVEGTSSLDGQALDTEVKRFVDNGIFLRNDPLLMGRALDLVDSYEANHGPLFMTESTKNGFPRAGQTGDAHALTRGMFAVQQSLLDQLFTTETVDGCYALFADRSWATSEYFPGAAPSPADPEEPHGVTIKADAPPSWGRHVAFDTDPVRRPTGYYLSPGNIGRVTVPAALVDAGYAVMVGAHTADHSNKQTHKRLDRVSRTYAITEPVTHIANPLGGGVYIIVPYLAEDGLVEVTLRGVIEAPFFSMRSFDETSPEEWKQRRLAPAPWADFETDTFMMQVPSGWIFAYDDPHSVMEDWDLAMNGVSDLLGYPHEKRNRTVLYEQVDVQIRHGVYGIGYPQINNAYNPHQEMTGDQDHWFLTNPTSWEVAYHELGHAQLMSMFPGETESIVNFLHAYVRNVQFGVGFDQAFQESFGPSYGDVGFSPDNAAIHWMITQNFRDSLPMDKSNTTKDQFRYQQRGYAKYADIARLFNWQVLRDFYHQEHLDYMDDVASDGLSTVDSRILRLSIAAGADLTPLIHFWGVHPEDAAALQEQMATHDLGASTEVRDQFLYYATIAPANNGAFKAHFDEVFPGMPSGGDPDYGKGWYNEWTDVWDETHGDEILGSIQGLLDLYYPGTQL